MREKKKDAPCAIKHIYIILTTLMTKLKKDSWESSYSSDKFGSMKFSKTHIIIKA